MSSGRVVFAQDANSAGGEKYDRIAMIVQLEHAGLDKVSESLPVAPASGTMISLSKQL